jgi:SAM-dependent methyltransferase
MLKAAFPEARIVACDLDNGMVEFCVRTFEVAGVAASIHPREIRLEEDFDLVWCGSLFTHLEPGRWGEYLRFLSDHLEPGGVLLFSTHGPWVAEQIRTQARDYLLSAEERDRLVRRYDEEGVAYATYPAGDREYGVSLASSSKLREVIAGIPALELLRLIERGWDDHQDVAVCRKRG